jgi:parvulin-like peptidyl-prolyl isomerase|tara:strand:+ start:221 stop:670 length:450 start_codon:yes stop_codon:yes gene_type:complete
VSQQTEEDQVTLDVMLEQLHRMEEREQQVMERFEHRQAERYNRLKNIEEEEEMNLLDSNTGNGSSSNAVFASSTECDISWSQIRSIEESRNAFLNHRAVVESSLRGTGLSQAHVIEVIEQLITDEMIDTCSKEVEVVLNELTTLVAAEA